MSLEIICWAEVAMISGKLVNSPSVTLYVLRPLDLFFSRVRLASPLESRPLPLRSSPAEGFIVRPLGGSKLACDADIVLLLVGRGGCILARLPPGADAGGLGVAWPAAAPPSPSVPCVLLR